VEAGWAAGPVCSRGKEKKKKGQPAWDLAGWARKGEREREKSLSFFFKFLSNSFFKHSNSNQMKTMHSNHDAQALIISKLFW
jgi:hypothetical protein